MKQFSIALMLVAMLLCVFGTSVVALERPYNADPWTPGGEDHPWGGDESSSDPTPLKSEVDSPTSFTTTYSIIDAFFYRHILPVISNWFESNPRAYHMERICPMEEPETRTVNQQTKGM
jgi:hypothetical protein